MAPRDDLLHLGYKNNTAKKSSVHTLGENGLRARGWEKGERTIPGRGTIMSRVEIYAARGQKSDTPATEPEQFGPGRSPPGAELCLSEDLRRGTPS